MLIHDVISYLDWAKNRLITPTKQLGYTTVKRLRAIDLLLGGLVGRDILDWEGSWERLANLCSLLLVLDDKGIKLGGETELELGCCVSSLDLDCYWVGLMDCVEGAVGTD